MYAKLQVSNQVPKNVSKIPSIKLSSQAYMCTFQIEIRLKVRTFRKRLEMTQSCLEVAFCPSQLSKTRFDAFQEWSRSRIERSPQTVRSMNCLSVISKSFTACAMLPSPALRPTTSPSIFGVQCATLSASFGAGAALESSLPAVRILARASASEHLA